MSSNFYNTSGKHVNGLEFHEYLSVAGKTDGHPHASGQYDFFWPNATLWKKAKDVTAETWSMLQQGYDFYLVAHYPVPLPPPDPGGETAVLAKIIATSGSKCQMAVMSVTSKGNPLACCISNMLSANQNCSDPIDLEINLVVNLNSVVTNPTPGDYKAAFWSGLVDKALGVAVGESAKWAVGKKYKLPPDKFNLKQELIVDAVKHAWRRAPDFFPIIEDITTKPTAEFVKQMVDGDAQ